MDYIKKMTQTGMHKCHVKNIVKHKRLCFYFRPNEIGFDFWPNQSHGSMAGHMGMGQGSEVLLFSQVVCVTISFL
jgi:hypothetical protein